MARGLWLLVLNSLCAKDISVLSRTGKKCLCPDAPPWDNRSGKETLQQQRCWFREPNSACPQPSAARNESSQGVRRDQRDSGSLCPPAPCQEPGQSRRAAKRRGNLLRPEQVGVCQTSPGPGLERGAGERKGQPELGVCMSAGDMPWWAPSWWPAGLGRPSYSCASARPARGGHQPPQSPSSSPGTSASLGGDVQVTCL